MPVAAGRKQRIITGKTNGKWASGKIGQHRMLWRNTRIFHSVHLQSKAKFLPRISTSQKRKLQRAKGIWTDNWKSLFNRLFSFTVSI